MDITSSDIVDFASDAERVSFLGLEFDPLDTEGTVQEIMVRADRACDLTYLVTPNVDHMVRLEAEPELRPLYTSAGILVCDSRILEVFAKFEGKRLPAAPGADIVEDLIRNRIGPDEKIVVIGGDDGIIESLSRDYGIAHIAWHAPPMGLRKNPAAVRDAAEFLVEENERFAFLCVGSPQQEMIASEAVRLGGGKGVALCCGASLEFLAGRIERAPKWMRDARLEWLHRLISEPKRMWKRYLVDGPRILAIWRRYRAN